MALTKISTSMISQSAAAVDLNIDAGTFYVDATNNRVGVGGKTDPDTPLHVSGTATATLFAGSGASLTNIPNAALTNSSITINSTATSLGGSLTLTTANIAENTNLYYTNARADARIAAASTSDLSEGTNLYYTDARVDARVSGGSLGNITTTGYIRGPSTFTIDPAAHGDNTGTVVIAGNLQVDGTQTVINSTTMTVDDKNITLASGSANAAAASGAGFTVDIGSGTLPSITYDGTNDEWDFNKDINVTGSVTAVGGTLTDQLLINKDDTGTALRVLGGSGGAYLAEFTRDVGGDGTIAINASGADPQIQFASSGNTFALGVNSNTFEISDNTHIGTNTRFAITSAGNVGIGTSSPSRQLELEGQGILRLNTTGASTDPGIDFNTSSTNDMQIRYRGATDKLAIYSYGTSSDVVTIQKSDGNVGIGTGAPSTPLHVVTNSSGYALKIEENSGGEAYEIGTDSYGGLVFFNSGTKVADFTDANNFQLYHSGAVKVNLNQNGDSYFTGGNVGIGTTSPTAKLHTKETVSNTISAATAGVKFDGSGSDGLAFGNKQSSPYTSWIQAGYLLDGYSPAFNNGYPIALNPIGGNVGIGTDDPGSKLEVYNSTIAGNTQLHIHNDKTGDAGVIRIEGGRTSTNDSAQILLANGGSLGSAIKMYSSGQEGDLRFYTSPAGSGNTLYERIRITNSGSFKHLSGAGTLEFAPLGGSSNLIEGGGSIKIKAAGGSVDLLNGTLESLNTTAQGITVNGPNSADLIINAPTDNASLSIKAGTSDTGIEEAVVTFYQNTSPKWQMGNITTNEFRLYNYATSSAAILVDTSGNVGIGTDDPADKLEIRKANSQLRLTDSDDDKFVQFSYSGGKLITRNNSTSTTVNQTTLTQDGKFGIGTINPSAFLHVTGSEGSKYSGSFNNTSSQGWGLFVKGGADSADYSLRVQNKDADELLTVKSNGNVGIGTGSPDYQVHIKKTGTAEIELEGTVSAELNLHDSSGTANQRRGRLTQNGAEFKLQALNDADDAVTHEFITMDCSTGKVGVGGTPANVNAGTFTAIDSGTSNGGIRTKTHSSTHYTDVVTRFSTAASSRYWHIKTNIQATNYVMFVARVHGYAYGNSGHIVDIKRSGYAHTSAGTIAGSQTVNNGSGTNTLDLYYAGNYLCFRCDAGDGYYTGLSFDIHLPSPTGYNFNFEVTANIMNNVSGSHYT